MPDLPPGPTVAAVRHSPRAAGAQVADEAGPVVATAAEDIGQGSGGGPRGQRRVPSALGGQLRTLRGLSQDSLRAVGEAAGISAAYLLKLEQGSVASPSPHVLRGLASHYGVSYLSLMRAAGYDVTDADHAADPRPRVSVIAEALAAQTLTESEERAMTAFLSSLRSR